MTAWAGKFCLIVGGGPSASEEKIRALAPGYDVVILVNPPTDLDIPSAYALTAHAGWMDTYRFRGGRVPWERRIDLAPGLKWRADYGESNFSGPAAVRHALHMGAAAIHLLGFDGRAVDGRERWHDDARAPWNPGDLEECAQQTEELIARFAPRVRRVEG